MAEFIKLYNENPNPKEIDKIVKILQKGGLIIYPTDTVYGLGCDITNTKGLEKIAKIKGLKLEKANFSFVCNDLSHLSDYVKQIDSSTFKILNSLIALETGVVDDSKTIIPWDGKKKFVKSWERDHNIETAIKHSVVPFYQEIARRIGKNRMQEYVKLAKYGNQNIGNSIDRFWLDGPIKISGYEQLNFIEDLYLGKLPFKKKHQDFVKKILIQNEVGNRIFSGKTGSSFKNGKFVFGWFVGHLKKGNDQYVFVINSKGDGESGHKLKEVVIKILQNMNL